MRLYVQEAMKFSRKKIIGELERIPMNFINVVYQKFVSAGRKIKTTLANVAMATQVVYVQFVKTIGLEWPNMAALHDLTVQPRTTL